MAKENAQCQGNPNDKTKAEREGPRGRGKPWWQVVLDYFIKLTALALYALSKIRDIWREQG